MNEAANETKSGPTGGKTSRMVCIALALLTVAVFGRTLGNDFFNLDDPFYVYENATVTGGLTGRGVVAAFEHGSPANWDPLTTLSHMVDWQIYGAHAWGHHLTNLLLHTATVVLLFLVLREMTGALWPSAFAAALFAIHPLRVESVAWVTERKDVLSGLFFVLTIGAYARYVEQSKVQGPSTSAKATADKKSKVFYGLALVCFALGLMSKAMLVTVPFVLLLLDWWPLKRFEQPGGTRRLLMEKLPMAGLAVASAVVGFLAQGRAVQSLDRISLPMRAGNALISCAAYLWQMVWPAGLAVYYPYPAHGLAVWEVVLSAVVLAAITWVAIALRKEQPYLLMGWLWYLGMLLPVIGLVQLGMQARADRYTYLPQIGIYIALAWFLGSLRVDWLPRRALAWGAAIVIAVLIAVSVAQAGYWHDSNRMWERTLACTSDNALAEYNFGMTLVKEQRLDEGLTHLQRAVEIQPTYVDAHNNLGSVYWQKGRLDEAVREFQTVLAEAPNDEMAHYNLGVAAMNRGRIDEAIGYFRRATELEPNDAASQSDLGNLLFQRGQVDEAVAHLQEALKVEPELESAQANLGRVAWTLATHPNAERRNGGQAIQLAREVVKLSGARNPGYIFTLAAACAEAGQFEAAAAYAAEARQLALAQSNRSLAKVLDDKVKQFQEGRPYRDQSLTNTSPPP